MRRLAASFAAAAALIASGCEREATPLKTTSALTSAEAELLRGIFGPDFATATIRKHYYDSDPHAKRRKRNGENTPAAYVLSGDGDNIHFITPEYHARDYARHVEHSGHLQLFVHEATHLWQHRIDPSSPGCRTYRYHLTADTRFADLCSEQQADAVGDYAAIFLAPEAITRSPDFDLSTTWGEREYLLMHMVERQFPSARATRLKMEMRAAAYRACLDAPPAEADVQMREIPCRKTYHRDLRGQPLLDAANQTVSFAHLAPAAAKG